MKTYYLATFLVFLSSFLFCQEEKVAKFLGDIEEGNVSGATQYLETNKNKIAADPDLFYLDAVLTEDGNSALEKYTSFLEKYPKHFYADAALYNIYSYNFSLGLYSKASEVLNKLKSDYPASKYIQLANLDIPDENVVEGNNPQMKPVEIAPDVSGTAAIDPVYKYSVQAGAFSSRGNAEKLKSDLEAAKIPAEISGKNVGGTVFNVVTAGRFENREEAGKFLQWLKENMKLTGRIIDL
jgi:hypothetical protein